MGMFSRCTNAGVSQESTSSEKVCVMPECAEHRITVLPQMNIHFHNEYSFTFPIDTRTCPVSPLSLSINTMHMLLTM